MKTFQRLPLVLVALAIAGCASLKSIPVFNPTARTLNRAASAEELLIEVNLEIAHLRDAGFLTQNEIDKALSPSLNRAESIIKAVRAVAHGASPTTQPAGTIDEARQILLSVKNVLEQIQRSHKP